MLPRVDRRPVPYGCSSPGAKQARPPAGVEDLENRLALSFVLGTTSLVEGPGSGTSSDIVTGSGNWTAQTTASWLHITTSSGSGNGLATFGFDANTGPTPPPAP